MHMADTIDANTNTIGTAITISLMRIIDYFNIIETMSEVANLVI